MNPKSANSTRIKLCGMTRPEDAALASSLGADAIGLIFYPKSPRNVTIAQAKKIIEEVNPLSGIVAVVVNPSNAWLNELIRALPIQMIQFHGDETPEFCQQFALPFIKAIRMQPGIDLAEKGDEFSAARGLLLDTYDTKQVGGTGRTFDWRVLEQVKNLRPEIYAKIILAGGLSPENIKEAVLQTGINNLDVNSGVESAPGVKDAAKMRQVMQLKNGN